MERVINEIKKVVFGKDEVIEKIIMCILSSGHALLEDIPGVGKTTLALAISKTLELKYNRMQFTSDVMPSDITGFMMYDKVKNEFKFREGPIICNMFLADEINRASSRTQSALLEVMEEHKVSIEGKQHNLDEPFFVIATQNPFGSAGTVLLPQSQMDRFMICVSMGYPSLDEEKNILISRKEGNPMDTIEKVLSKEDIMKYRKEVDNVYVEEDIYDYVISLVNKTRNHPEINVGCSPRGSLAIIKLAKSRAYMKKRDYVLPEDVKYIFVDACVHRIVPKAYDNKCISNKRINILKGILNSVSEPSIKRKV